MRGIDLFRVSFAILLTRGYNQAHGEIIGNMCINLFTCTIYKYYVKATGYRLRLKAKACKGKGGKA